MPRNTFESAYASCTWQWTVLAVSQTRNTGSAWRTKDWTRHPWAAPCHQTVWATATTAQESIPSNSIPALWESFKNYLKYSHKTSALVFFYCGLCVKKGHRLSLTSQPTVMKELLYETVSLDMPFRKYDTTNQNQNDNKYMILCLNVTMLAKFPTGNNHI